MHAVEQVIRLVIAALIPLIYFGNMKRGTVTYILLAISVIFFTN